MSINENNYNLLGVHPNATPKELRQAYLQLLVSAHPDKGGSAEGFAAIQKAYATLSDPAERAIYDEQLNRKNKSTATAAPIASHKHGTTSQSVTTTKNGVTAYVHGQTNFPPQRPDSDRPVGGAAIFAGQPINVESTKTSISSISERIRLLKINKVVSSSENGESSVLELQQQKKKSLAALYAQRAALHVAAGRAHHATFDIEEALRIWPECSEATDLLEKLKKDCCLEKENETNVEGGTAVEEQ